MIQIALKKIKKNSLKNKLILKTQQRFKSERHNVFSDVVNKIAKSSSDDKIMQSTDSICICICIWNKQRSNM